MDCDSKVVKKDYIDTYLKKIVPNTVLYGGRTYQNTPPKEQQHRLHWFVGKAREEKRASERQKQAWHSFMTNNYLIPKEPQLAFPFEERLNEYGHEDTLFGLQLEKADHNITHLDNPLEHIGLEDGRTFLGKSEKAIKNLVFLAQEYPEMETKLWKTAMRFRALKLDRVMLNYFRKRREKWEKKLLKPVPDLSLFDVV